MAEIPALVWIVVGIFVSIFSVIIVFRSGEPFFILMIFAGIGMLVFGGIKIFLRNRNQESLVDEMRKRHSSRGDSEAEINMDDYRRQRSGQHHQQAQRQQAPSPTPKSPPPQQQSNSPPKGQQGFCSQCGTPLLKQHKFCPICGARV